MKYGTHSVTPLDRHITNERPHQHGRGGHQQLHEDHQECQRLRQLTPTSPRPRSDRRKKGYDDSENSWLSWYDFSPDMRKITTTMPTTEPDPDADF